MTKVLIARYFWVNEIILFILGWFMFLSFSGNMFIFSCSFELRHIAKNAGLLWSPVLKKWYTPYYSIAINLKKYADDSALKEFKKSEIQITDVAPETVWPKGLTPRPYQLGGVAHATTRSRCLLRHDPGTGKTIEAALCMNAIPGKTLIICPPFLKINWMREINTWCVPKRSVTLVETGEIKLYDLSVDVLIVPDSLVINSHVRQALIAHKFEWLFIDEIHRFKSHEAQRTLAVLGGQKGRTNYGGLIPLAKRVVGLTGTPMPARPIELWPMLNALAPQVIDHMTRFRYAEKYCNAFFDGFGWNLNGASHQDELATRLKLNFMHTVKKSEVLTELPDKIYDQVFIDSSELKKDVASFDKQAMADFAIEDMTTKALGKLAAHRKDLGEAKADFAIKYIKDLLENSDESILVFAWHKSVLKKVCEKLAEFQPFLITGETPNKTRMEYVDEFQTNKNRRLFVGNIQAMGVGLTLTKATRVIFIEYSWTPSDNEQAEDRCHRIGQTRAVFIQYLVVNETIDEWVLDSIRAKQMNIKRIVG